MPRIFLSHANQDSGAACELKEWLVRNGWDDIFLDRDPEQGIRAGESWQQALLDAADHCQAIICLITPLWLSSRWCWAEYVLGKKLGKRCFPLIVAPLEWDALPVELRAEHQIIDLREGDTAYTRLRIGLQAAGVEASGFALAEGRPPYPGLQALTEADAALFFGRDTEILAALDELRRMAETPSRRLLVLLGASGTGKSSLLRAGLWPRLARDERNFLPLPPVRPAGAVLSGASGLWACLEGAMGREALSRLLPTDLPRSRGAIGQTLGGDHEALGRWLGELQTAAARASLLPEGRRPGLILLIDQGEELFGADAGPEAEHFLDLLGGLLRQPRGPLAVIAIRTDAYPLLQAEDRIPQGLHQPFNLAPMPSHRYREVILGPADRVDLDMEAALCDRLIEDASGADALPLLAFTMERLYREFGAEGRLGLAHYQGLGGVRGAIEAAVKTAFELAPRRGLPADHEVLAELTRALFLPHLVRVNDSGDFIRRRAARSALPSRVQPLADLLVEHHLLLSDRDQDEGETLEVAHEAVLRAWQGMTAWLEAERDFLLWREEIGRARLRWEAQRRDLLSGRELAIAQGWLEERPDNLDPEDLDFITASQQRATELASQARRRQTRRLRLAVTAAVLMAVLGGMALWQARVAGTARDVAIEAQKRADRQAEIAKAKKQEAQIQAAVARARELAMRSHGLLQDPTGQTTAAGLLAVESLHSAATLEGQQAWQSVMALMPGDITPERTPWPWARIVPSPDGRLGALYRFRSDGSSEAPASGRIQLVTGNGLRTGPTYRADGHVWPRVSPDGRWLAIAGYGGRLQVVDLESEALALEVPRDYRLAAAFGPASRRLYVAGADGTVAVREAPDWRVVEQLRFADRARDPYRRVAIRSGPKGRRLLIVTDESHAFLLTADGRTGVTLLKGHENHVMEGVFAPTGDYLATRSRDRTVRLWKLPEGTPLHRFTDPSHLPSALGTSPDGAVLLAGTRGGDVHGWDAGTGAERFRLGVGSWVNDLAVSPDGNLLATASDNGLVTLWRMQDGGKLAELPHDDEVWTVNFSHDGRRLFSGGKDRQLRIFDAEDGSPLATLPLAGPVMEIVETPDGENLAVALRGSEHAEAWTELRVVEQETGRELSRIRHNGRFRRIAFSPDGDVLATTSPPDDRLKLWDSHNGKLIADTGLAAGEMRFTADGKRLLAGASGSQTFLLDAADGRPLHTLGEPGGIEALGISADGSVLTTFGQDFTFRLWEATKGQELGRATVNRPDHRLEFSADGNRFADFSTDRQTIQVGETGSGRILLQVAAGERPWPMLTADGRRLLLLRSGIRTATGQEQRISEYELWDVDEGLRLLTQRVPNPSLFADLLPRNRFALVSNRIVNGEPRGVVSVLDAEAGEELWSRPLPEPGFAEVFGYPNRPQLMAIEYGGQLEIRDAASGALRYAIPFEDSQRQAVSPDGGLLAAARRRGDRTLVAIHRLDDGRRLHQWPVHGHVPDLRFSRDGSYLLVALSGDSVTGVSIRQTRDWSESGFIDLDARPNTLRLLGDPDLLAIHDSSDTVRVWRLSTARQLYRLAHTATADSFALSTGAPRAVTWRGGSLRLWDTDNGVQIARRRAEGEVRAGAISPDGRLVAYHGKRPRAAGGFRSLILWRPGEADANSSLTLENPGTIRIDPSGSLLAVARGRQGVQLLQADPLRILKSFSTLPGSTLGDFNFGIGAELLLITERSGSDGLLRVWELSSGRELARFDYANAVRTPGSAQLLSQDGRGEWWRWSPYSSGAHANAWPIESPSWTGLQAAGGRLFHHTNSDGLAYLEPASGKRATVYAPPRSTDRIILDRWATAPDGRHVAAAISLIKQGSAEVSQRRVVVTRVDDGSQLATLPHRATVAEISFLNGQDALLTAEAANELGTLVGTRLLMWDLRTRQSRTLIMDNPVNAIQVGPDGTVFATAEGHRETGDGYAEGSRAVGKFQARIWRADSGEELLRLPHDEPVLRLAFSPDGRLLATRGAFQISVFRVSDAEKLFGFRMTHGMDGGPAQVDFAGGGRLLLANVGDINQGDGSEQGVRVWDLQDGSKRLLHHDTDWPTFLVAGDGNYAATREREGRKNTLRVWKLDTGTEVFRTSLTDVSDFLLDGGRLLIQSRSQVLALPWHEDAMIAEACARMTRNLSAVEWVRFMGDEPYRPTCPEAAEAEW